MILPVILSGGSGSRLWPLSRELYPKQFLPLVGEHSMLQETVLRVVGIADMAAPLVICNHEHRFMVAEQLRMLAVEPAAVLLEPIGRNTAPAVTVAALHAQAMHDDPILLILPADHVITDVAGFQQAVESVTEQAASGRLLTFGITPTEPETGYGYIRAGNAIADNAVFRVAQFVEKPDPATAQRYLAEGGYFWNSGMFMFRASALLQEMERWAPDILSACREAYSGGHHDLDFFRLNAEAFAACPGNSIDYAIMEHTGQAAMVPLACGWSDVGSWSALWQVGTRDADDNVFQGDVLSVDSHDSYVYAGDRLVATVGVDNLVVVETPDAVLVAHKERVQEVKKVVERLQSKDRAEGRSHRKVYRPWGSYDSIDVDRRFQVKHITVNPGASLSLQMHHHRAEHWVVVSGTARVTKGEDTFLLSENQSTYIPLGTSHRLENPGKIPLELIEVQSGSYLGEDDIVRFDDVYGRGQG